LCYFSNFNIHPLSEFISRLESFRDLMQAWELDSIVDGEYGLERFIDAVGLLRDAPERCRVCYRIRMQEAARKAGEMGCDGFTTTLLVSPHQPQELIREAAESAALKLGTQFLYRDFRPGHSAAASEVRKLGLYMQKYCGCIFSEKERFRKRLQRLSEAG
jgi:predicted adenine nucleotide alpha hydrolase (AANH) superfamily ATPase